jgi:uncharacterized protein YxeA
MKIQSYSTRSNKKKMLFTIIKDARIKKFTKIRTKSNARVSRPVE